LIVLVDLVSSKPLGVCHARWIAEKHPVWNVELVVDVDVRGERI
jgi:hypothetical protein